MGIVVATRFTQEVIDELDEVARERKRTRSEIIREAVQVYLAEWADYAIALDRLKDPNDPILTEEEAWAMLGLSDEDIEDDAAEEREGGPSGGTGTEADTDRA